MSVDGRRFRLARATITITGPTSMTDAEAGPLADALADDLEMGLEAVRERLAEKYSGYDLQSEVET